MVEQIKEQPSESNEAKTEEKTFQRKVRLVINTLHLVQKTSRVDIEVVDTEESGQTTNSTAEQENAPKEKRFQAKVKSLINVIKFSTFSFSDNKVTPAPTKHDSKDKDDNFDEEIDVLITPHLEHFMHKLEDDEEIEIESSEEGMLATNLIEELTG